MLERKAFKSLSKSQKNRRLHKMCNPIYLNKEKINYKVLSIYPLLKENYLTITETTDNHENEC